MTGREEAGVCPLRSGPVDRTVRRHFPNSADLQPISYQDPPLCTQGSLTVLAFDSAP
jgi:hypothetical protein